MQMWWETWLVGTWEIRCNRADRSVEGDTLPPDVAA